jgi:hypothetical protein
MSWFVMRLVLMEWKEFQHDGECHAATASGSGLDGSDRRKGAAWRAVEYAFERNSSHVSATICCDTCIIISISISGDGELDVRGWQ